MSSKITRTAGMDVESSGSDSDEEKPGSSFVNPLAKAKKMIDAAGELSEGSWSDDDMSDGQGDSKKKKK